MAVDLSAKKVPNDVPERLRARVKRNHRSLQGELLSILEGAAGPRWTVTIQELLARGRARKSVADNPPSLSRLPANWTGRWGVKCDWFRWTTPRLFSLCCSGT